MTFNERDPFTPIRLLVTAPCRTTTSITSEETDVTISGISSRKERKKPRMCENRIFIAKQNQVLYFCF